MGEMVREAVRQYIDEIYKAIEFFKTHYDDQVWLRFESNFVRFIHHLRHGETEQAFDVEGAYARDPVSFETATHPVIDEIGCIWDNSTVSQLPSDGHGDVTNPLTNRPMHCIACPLLAEVVVAYRQHHERQS